VSPHTPSIELKIVNNTPLLPTLDHISAHKVKLRRSKYNPY